MLRFVRGTLCVPHHPFGLAVAAHRLNFYLLVGFEPTTDPATGLLSQTELQLQNHPHIPAVNKRVGVRQVATLNRLDKVPITGVPSGRIRIISRLEGCALAFHGQEAFRYIGQGGGSRSHGLSRPRRALYLLSYTLKFWCRTLRLSRHVPSVLGGPHYDRPLAPACKTYGEIRAS